MGESLNWKFTNGDGLQEIPSSNITKYLKKYIDDKFIIKIDNSENNYKERVKFLITELGKRYFSIQLDLLEYLKNE